MEEVFVEMGLVRRNLSEKDREALEREEQDAAALDSPAKDPENECVVCRVSHRTLVIMPCLHLATCHRCTVMIRRMNKCPVCRGPISETKRREETNESSIFIV